MNKEGMKAGEAVTCHNPECGKVVVIAAVDVPYQAPDSSKFWLLHDGTPMPYQWTLRCPHCGNGFDSISTVRKETEDYLEKWGYRKGWPPSVIKQP